MTCIGQIELRKLIGKHYNDLIAEFGAEDFNVVKESFDEAIAIQIDDDPTKDMEDDIVVYNNEDLSSEESTDEVEEDIETEDEE